MTCPSQLQEPRTSKSFSRNSWVSKTVPSSNHCLLMKARPREARRGNSSSESPRKPRLHQLASRSTTTTQTTSKRTKSLNPRAQLMSTKSQLGPSFQEQTIHMRKCESSGPRRALPPRLISTQALNGPRLLSRRKSS